MKRRRPHAHLKISKFWHALAAGKPLGLGWAVKDLEIVCELGTYDELPMDVWMTLGEQRQRQILLQALEEAL